MTSMQQDMKQHKPIRDAKQWWRSGATLTALLLLAACSGGGADTQENPPPPGGGNTGGNYAGPPPASADVQRFKLNLWDNLLPANRCGSCHGIGGQLPNFVRNDDINLAYAQANTVVNLQRPSESRMVSKVAGGHHCWLTDNNACADTITRYITAWAGGSVGGGSTVVQLVPPVQRDAGASRTFPASSAGFAATIHPLLKTHCARCHADTASERQSPFFASNDVELAYASAQAKIDLDTPANSRLVQRLRDEFHNCWGDCAANAATMQAAISAFAGGIAPTQVDPALVISKALRLTDGVIASQGGRHEANVIALYEFKTGTGSTAFDTSGVEPAMNLTLSGDTEWVGGWGVLFRNGGRAQASTTSSRKLHQLIRATGEYSIEAWVAPANVSQEGPARMVSYAGSASATNFTLGQSLYNYNFLQRSSTTGANGLPALSTADAAQRAQTALQHVVAVYDAVNGRRLYVNGEDTGDRDPRAAGTLADWDDTFAFVIGNEVSGDRPWSGIARLVAVHNRALTAAQIKANFDAGVGERFYLLFNVSPHLDTPGCDKGGVPQCYVMLEASRMDTWAYLFHTPVFVSLDSSVTPANVPLRGLRVGLNGRELENGQAWQRLDLQLSQSRQTLSPLGTVVPVEKGPQADEFFLSFERLGSRSHVVIEPEPPAPSPRPEAAPVADIGMRTFDEINASFAALTGVPAQRDNVRDAFVSLRQALPTVENPDAFLSAHQMAVTQLAIAYCDALVEDSSLRAALFPGFAFEQAPASAFAGAGRDQVLSPLLARMLGSNLATQPDSSDVRSELDQLLSRLISCGNSCPASRTPSSVKALCAAALGSAAVTLQ